MAQIQPVSTWFQGAEHQANVFSCYSSGDNLLDSAIIKYQLIELIVISPEEQTSQTLLSGEIPINGQDYIDWDSSVSANEWIYQWAANELNLILV